MKTGILDSYGVIGTQIDPLAKKPLRLPFGRIGRFARNAHARLQESHFLRLKLTVALVLRIWFNDGGTQVCAGDAAVSGLLGSALNPQ